MANESWSLDGGIHEVPLPHVGGRLWLCGKHVVGPDPDAALQRVEADTIVCLVEQHELADRYPNYVAWLSVAPPTRAVRFPINDLSAPGLTTMRPFLDDLVARLRRGDGLIVHCGAGIGRAGTTAVAVLVLLGEPLDAALTQVRAHRPMAGPEGGMQMALVRALADDVARSAE
jgi:protein tyrosine/serine phosphatase